MRIFLCKYGCLSSKYLYFNFKSSLVYKTHSISQKFQKKKKSRTTSVWSLWYWKGISLARLITSTLLAVISIAPVGESVVLVESGRGATTPEIATMLSKGVDFNKLMASLSCSVGEASSLTWVTPVPSRRAAGSVRRRREIGRGGTDLRRLVCLIQHGMSWASHRVRPLCRHG